MGRAKDAEKRAYAAFSEVAAALGYSPLHGKIIAVLMVKDMPMSLQELAKETGYSAGMLSLSIDLLDILGVVKKGKMTGDRRLYVSLQGDLLECLKNAVITKARKSIDGSLREFQQARQQLEPVEGPEKASALRTIDLLEGQLQRLDRYIELLARARLPEASK
ncbi:MAG: hypothetical protein HY519_02320 [Candidatus Aenigmarchaeota archaeon]|nr:hypothetical protein [Candidatus Aenigmarchaeota archaeon]